MNPYQARRIVPDDAIGAPKAVSAAADEYRKLALAQREASRAVDQAIGARKEAIASDRASLAASLRAGEADPGNKAVAKADAEIEAAKRKLEALNLAVAAAADDMEARVQEHRGAWLAALEKRGEEGRWKSAARRGARATASPSTNWRQRVASCPLPTAARHG